jgi:hypothetical protein
MRDRRRRRDRIATFVSFSSFFAFPAIPVGRTVAVTIPVVVAAALALAWMRRLKASEVGPYAWMIAPTILSGCYLILVGAALAPDIVPKAVVAMAMSLFVLIPARHLLRRGYGEPFILGAAYAILVHAALGAYQSFAFDRGEFPFADLMRTNPAMALLTEDTPTYVEYVKRPFGLFAEPSAMAACVGPWLVLITSALFARRGGSRLRTAVLALALGSGIALVSASKSGLAAPIVAGTAITALAAAFSWRRRVGVRLAGLVLSAAIALASVVWLSENAGSRFDLDRNDSWQARLESLDLAARSLAASFDSGAHPVVGVGPGQSYSAINSTDLKYQADASVTAVWSVGLNYALETGLLGVLAMLALGASAAASIWASRARLAGAMCAFVWLFGVFAGTSYVGQPALWTGLAALLSWRSVTRGA